MEQIRSYDISFYNISKLILKHAQHLHCSGSFGAFINYPDAKMFISLCNICKHGSSKKFGHTLTSGSAHCWKQFLYKKLES